MTRSLTYDPSLGEDITETARRMVDLAKQNGCTVTARFNGVNLSAAPATMPEDVVRGYNDHDRLAREARAHRDSPEGKAEAGRDQREKFGEPS